MMTIHLPPHLESSLQAAVRSGRFTSLDDAMARAATLLLEELGQEPTEALASVVLPPDPRLGVWRDAADEMRGSQKDLKKDRHSSVDR